MTMIPQNTRQDSPVVVPAPGEDFERLLRRFKKRLNNAKVLKDLKFRRRFVSRGSRRREKYRLEGQRRWRKEKKGF